MKEIVWIFGTSSTGKQTFINNVISDKKLSKKLGWSNKRISICKRSINFIGDLGMPHIVKERKLITEDVTELLKTSDVVLIKWQYVDSSCEIPQELQKLLPNVRQRIILLKANNSELLSRLNTNDWWKNIGFTDASELLGYENKMVTKFMSDLNSSFEVTTVGSDTEEYKIL